MRENQLFSVTVNEHNPIPTKKRRIELKMRSKQKGDRETNEPERRKRNPRDQLQVAGGFYLL